MILIKSFFTGVLYDCFKLIYLYLNEGDKVRECYSCLKIWAQLHVDFSTFFSLNVHHLNDSIYIWNNQAQFLNKKMIRSVWWLKFLREIFYNSQFKKYNCNPRIVTIWVDIPSLLHSHGVMKWRSRNEVI